MKSAKIEVEPIRSATVGVENSRLSSPARGTVLVRVRREHAVGLGEACPLPGYGPDRIEDATRELAAASGLTVPTFTAPGEIFEWVALHVGAQSPAARFALETALLDVLAQERCCPLWALFIDRESANVAIEHATLLPREDVLGAASRAVDSGARALKLKIGFPGAASTEVATIRELSHSFPTIPLRLDANGAFATDEWLAFESRLDGIQIELVEEPVRREDFPWPIASTRVALDESLQERHWTPAVRDWALSPGNCGVFVMKPMMLGGWSRCLELFAAARSAGIRCVVSHAFGGGVEYAACHHLAVVCQQGHSLAAGLGPHPGLTNSLHRFDVGRLALASGLGLGARVTGNIR